jgi:hypothetical protein
MARVAADELDNELAGLFETTAIIFACGLPQPPMQVQLRLEFAGIGVEPFAAARHHDGCRAK